MKLWPATKLFTKQCYRDGNFLKFLFKIKLYHLFLSHGKIFVPTRQWQINMRKRHPLYRPGRIVEATYLCSVQATQCSYRYLPHINPKLLNQQPRNNHLCLLNMVPVLPHVFHSSINSGQGEKRNPKNKNINHFIFQK